MAQELMKTEMLSKEIECILGKREELLRTCNGFANEQSLTAL